MTDLTPTQDTITARLECLAEWYEEPSYPRDFAQGKALIAADIRAILSERATLKAELEEARGANEAVHAAMLRDTAGNELGQGWDIGALNDARPLIRAALALATKEPTNV